MINAAAADSKIENVPFISCSHFLARILPYKPSEDIMRDRIVTDQDTSFHDTPNTISTGTWVTVTVLALIVILGALMLGGFFSSAWQGNEQTPTTDTTK